MIFMDGTTDSRKRPVALLDHDYKLESSNIDSKFQSIKELLSGKYIGILVGNILQYSSVKYLQGVDEKQVTEEVMKGIQIAKSRLIQCSDAELNDIFNSVEKIESEPFYKILSLVREAK